MPQVAPCRTCSDWNDRTSFLVAHFRDRLLCSLTGKPSPPSPAIPTSRSDVSEGCPDWVPSKFTAQILRFGCSRDDHQNRGFLQARSELLVGHMWIRIVWFLEVPGCRACGVGKASNLATLMVDGTEWERGLYSCSGRPKIYFKSSEMGFLFSSI